ncbi:hypothetical protein SDC9_124061 [bioreactor metagenome]|uniref:Uncharacterized protein n=1 Tax=bioreactor metagenome TaxID=1076179 RepID=A0A645CJX5_9ZZZZ
MAGKVQFVIFASIKQVGKPEGGTGSISKLCSQPGVDKFIKALMNLWLVRCYALYCGSCSKLFEAAAGKINFFSLEVKFHIVNGLCPYNRENIDGPVRIILLSHEESRSGLIVRLCIMSNFPAVLFQITGS